MLFFSLVCRVRIDLGFLIDVSHGMRRDGGSTLPQLKRFIRQILRRFALGSRHTRVGIITYSTKSRAMISIHRGITTRTLTRVTSRIRFLRGPRRTGRALRYARKYLFRGKPRCGRRRVLIVVTSGRSGDRVRKPSSELQAVGVEIVAVSIGGGGRRQVTRIASTRSHVFVVGIKRLVKIVGRIQARVCTASVCRQRMDLGFLIDISSQVRRANIGNIRLFIKEMVRRFVVSRRETRVGIVVYSS
ncbi:predicted protein, partial [Nematostella vectensis]